MVMYEEDLHDIRYIERDVMSFEKPLEQKLHDQINQKLNVPVQDQPVSTRLFSYLWHTNTFRYATWHNMGIPMTCMKTQ